MAINALNPNSMQAFRPPSGGGLGPAPLQGGPQQSGGARGDQMGLSRETQQAGGRGGGAERLTQALAQGVGQVLQAQSSGDQNSGNQALQGLKQTYDQGAQSGQIEQVPGPIRQAAESLLGLNKGQEGRKGGGGGGCGGGGGAKESGGGGAKESGGGEQAGDKQGGPEQAKESQFDEETLKKLEELLGRDKAEECKKDGKCDKHKQDDKEAKTDSKAGDANTDAKTDVKADSKVDAPKKTIKPAAPQAPRGGGGGKKKAA